MNSAPWVSVIIATCRRVALALTCIESVVRNTYPNFEIIVVDQDPERRLEYLLNERFPKERRLVYKYLDVQMLSRARNVGLAVSRGEIIAFLDDDAVVGTDWLANYVEAFVKIEPTPGAVAGRLVPRWEAPPPAWMPEERLYLLGIYDRGLERGPMPKGDLPIGANFAVLRTAAREVGSFNEALGFSHSRRACLLAGEDSLFTMSIRNRGYHLYYEPKAVAEHLVSAAKMRLAYLAKRNYWEGATSMALLFMTGKISRASCLGIASHHLRRALFEAYRACVRETLEDSRIPSRRKVVRAYLNCCNSAGIVFWAWRLWKYGRLP